jgi:hypothetical protein
MLNGEAIVVSRYSVSIHISFAAYFKFNLTPRVQV